MRILAKYTSLRIKWSCPADSRKLRGSVDPGHVTGRLGLAGSPSQRFGTMRSISMRCDLAKVNPKCHMNRL